MTSGDKKDLNDYVDENEEYEFFEYIAENGEYEEESDDEYDAFAVLGTYQGQRNSNNERHGFGKTILPNGDFYVGTYKNGMRHGYGVYQFKSGCRYQGCYKYGLRNGKGVMFYTNNAKYEGFWQDNKKDGDGVFKYENNDEFSGSWKSDLKHGVGSYTFCKTGVVLKGKWLDDKKVENFELYFPTNKGEGFTFHGTWNDKESVDGDGYFVFENLNCMLKGVHIKNSFDKNMNFDDKQNNDNCNSYWFSHEIMPIVNNMLPRLAKKQPMLKKSSCELDLPSTHVHPYSQMSTALIETYDVKDNLWTEMDELETGIGLNEGEQEVGSQSSGLLHEQQ